MIGVIIDVLLPCLDEAAALPWVLDRMPVGYRPIVVDNGSVDGSAAIARSAGATVVTAERRGYGAACHTGLLAASSGVVCVMDADASLDPGELPDVAGPVLAGEFDLVLGRRTTRSLRTWPPPARLANAALARTVRRRTGLALRDLGPMRAFRRADLLALELSDRRSGYPLQTLLAASRRRMAGCRGAGPLPAAGGPVEGDRHVARIPPRGPGHASGAGAMTASPAEAATREAQVVVLAKSPVPGLVKTRLTPPYTAVAAAALARAALVDTLCAAASASVRRALLVLDGEPGDWLPAGLAVRPQRGGRLDQRIAHALVDAWNDLPVPVVLVGMDTPQVTAADLDHAADRLLEAGTDAVLGPAVDGGYWAIGLRRPRIEHVASVPMSQADTGARQLVRLESCGLRVRLLETRRDVDHATDAVLVAAEAPGGRFAAELARLSVGAA